MASNTAGPTNQLEECLIIYNPAETDSDKISTKLSGVIIDATTSVTNGGGCKVTKISNSSTAEEKRQVKQKIRRPRVAIVFVITEDILVGVERIFLDAMVDAAVSAADFNKILTVYYKVPLDRMPQPLRVNDMLDYESSSFKVEIHKVVEEWQLPSKEVKSALPDPDMFKVACYIMVEVHPTKGSAKQKQNKAADLKLIRETIYTVLMDPINPLSQILLDDYSLLVRDVSQNPVKVICKVKDEDKWGKLKKACDNRTLGSIFMQHVLDFQQKDLHYEIKLIPQKDLSAPVDSASPSPINSIVCNLIFDMIKKKEFTTYDFYQKLVGFRDKIDLRAIRSDPDGYNPLHALLVNNRLPLMLPLVQLKLFTVYLHETVPIASPSSFRGQTLRQLAESKKARRFRDALMEHEKLVHSMGKFLKACHDGDMALVARMLHANRQLVNEKDAFKNNCLYCALVSNNLELFILLLDNKADHNNINESRESLLHVACMLGHHTFIDVLMGRCKQDVTATCSNKRTPLERVAENGDIECVKELLKHRVSLTACVLPYAAANGRLPFIKYVLEEMAMPLPVDSRDNTGRSALMKACETGPRELLDYLLIKGASVNVEDLRRRTPLHVACENGHEDIVSILLNKGASLDVQDCYTGAELCFLIRGKDKGRKAWHYVEVRRNVVHIFLQKTRAGQVDVAVYGTVVKSGWGEDPEKAIVDWVEKMFSDRRSSPSATPDLTPLHMAIYKQHPDVARMLIEKGANLHIKDYFGLTPFMLCALRNDKDTAILLEEKGANVHDRDKEGNTALAIAEKNEQTEMTNYIKGKTYFTQTEAYVESALRSALQALQKEKLEELRADGGDVRRHIIDTVRQLTIDNNKLLMDLGSGPIMKASSGIPNEAAAAGVGIEAAGMGAPTRSIDSGIPASVTPTTMSIPVRATADNPSATVSSINRQTFTSSSLASQDTLQRNSQWSEDTLTNSSSPSNSRVLNSPVNTVVEAPGGGDSTPSSSQPQHQVL